MIKNIQTYILFAILTGFFSTVYSQTNGSSDGWGGVADVFDLPVGAKAMAMGGAFVSLADDPFALYWNPAALENVQQQSFSFYHTNLLGDTQYDYLAYAHPTLSFGTFSSGILRLSTGDIPIRDEDPTYLGSLSYGRTLFLLGYGLRPFDWISVGTTLKVERVNFPGYVEQASGQAVSIIETGFGADFGLLVTPPLSNEWLQNIAVGLNIQNVIKRSVKAVDVNESAPRNYRFGISKMHYMGTGGNHILVALEVDQNEKKINNKRMPLLYHFGAEYCYRQSANLQGMFRIGAERRQKSSGSMGLKPTFGLGAKYSNFQIDYSFWSWDSDIGGTSHRISFVFKIGKTREEKIAENNERETRRIEEEVKNRQRIERAENIDEGLASARMRFNQGDYERALVFINRVLAYDQTGSDEDLQNARVWHDRIQSAIDEKREKAAQEAVEKNVKEQDQKRQLERINEHVRKADIYYESEEFSRVLMECDAALSLDSNRTDIKELRDKAERDLKEKIVKLSTEAEALAKKNRVLDALTKYNQAAQVAREYNPVYASRIEGRMKRLQNRLDYQDLRRRAAAFELDENWAMAAETYKSALKYEPDNKSLQKKYDDANARANARKEEMTEQVTNLYRQGFNAYMGGNYDEAIKFYEEARKYQPLNEVLFDAIDAARNAKKKNAANDKEN